MSAEQDQEKTLPATQRRLEKAHEEGSTPRSMELMAAGGLLAVTLALWLAGPSWFDAARRLVGNGLQLNRDIVFEPAALTGRLYAFALDGLILAAPLMLTGVIAILVCSVAVGGWMFNVGNLAFKAERLSPAATFGRIFSLGGLGEVSKTVLKATLIGIVGAWFVWKQSGHSAGLAAAPLPAAIGDTGSTILSLLGVLTLVAVLIAAIDVPLAIWRFRNNLKMTLEEVKRESRESDGDPHVKARIRAQQREAARRRMMSEVPKADVVVTNPTHFAVALSYREGEMHAPRVVAKGSDLVAARIREIAAGAGVPLLEAPPLARALHRHAEIGDEVPVALYGAVAQVLAWVFELRRANATGLRSPVAPAEVPIPDGYDPAAEAA